MTYHPLSAVKYLTIHYSATPIERSYSLADIDAMHVRRGFNGIGYHAYGPRTGGWQEGRKVTEAGRFEQGAHSKGENDEALGYCYEGGVSTADLNHGYDTRTPAQKKAMIEWIDTMLALTGGDGIDPSKGPVVRGHKDMPGAATQCPGFDAGAWWIEVQRQRAVKRSFTAVEEEMQRQHAKLVPSWLRWLVRAFGAEIKT
ncbi:N-acetylmuramoyl-L-alanine amidase [Roseivivax marinus]|uniref:N-acetylmuramoyl-L-alanine amidase n=1 Tax=Roseivivax marinus TaxID=1379903 RepID=W4HG16_9RHOB|nr:N-acetylmuramoyl-L-alanine amidase [Roseivivax marinus]ETW10910.1 N-acetylmuramoyl-L-alanine amidase [Roseivivax marinus]